MALAGIALGDAVRPHRSVRAWQAALLRLATLDACLSSAEEVRLACEDAVFALCPPADRDELDDALHRCRTSAAASAAAGADVCDDVEVSGAARDAANALSL